MACVSVSMALPLTSATQNKLNSTPSSSAPYFRPLPKKTVVKKSELKEKSVAGLTAAALTASLVIPEMAHAAGNDFSPSLKNFLLSIAAGGIVLTAIFGAVIGVSNFDPVKRT
ncbi:hypothetical protein TanjilG_30285 [Lupinus angustifolius]|uniref:Uncharacterized protein n=1 Tax=Lupinus angustifolius TaxID=3871 RepID=A0A4P1R731_LUPAN|nr:PREDICTED: uncharacterized protein LOC109358190 [Lupinus angustifolius]XP_019457827.1 PREDICTED: uncharacterized protein LOC109358190 [Lupinus angustifolius]XP_019457829.1 PREDICTED: uncharacterized protein LOC109358190 [Lupinus angustifolius]OIW04009.1 hypothetical protein TanjilG_30285 [Lupinus angustifolius]